MGRERNSFVEGGEKARRSKHMRRWISTTTDRWGKEHTRPLLTRVPTLGGRVVEGGRQYPVESKSTAPWPWKQRAKNRRRNRAARRSRIANAQRARRG